MTDHAISEVTIALASARDEEAVVALDRRVIGDDHRRQLLAQAIEDQQCYVAKFDGALVAFATFNQSFFEQGFISLLLVDPAYRRRGIASALIRHLEARCPTPKLFTSTNVSNTAMQLERVAILAGLGALGAVSWHLSTLNRGTVIHLRTR